MDYDAVSSCRSWTLPWRAIYARADAAGNVLGWLLGIRSQMFFNWKSTDQKQLNTERIKNRRAINARVGFQLLPLPRDISAKCGGCRPRKAIQNQSLTRSVLNPRSPEVWRQTGGEREFRVSAGVVAVRRFSREARGYWASMRARKPAENVGRGTTGGGRATGSNGLLQNFAGLRSASPPISTHNRVVASDVGFVNPTPLPIRIVRGHN